MANPSTPTPEQARPRGRRRLLLGGLFTFFILCGAAYGGYWEKVGRYRQSTDDAYVQGNLLPVMPQVSGTIVGIYTDDTRLVTEGQPVVKLGHTDARVALDRATANLAATVRRVQQLYQTEAQLRAKVRMEQARLVQSRKDYHHYRQLEKHGYYPAESTQHTATDVDVATSSLAAARHELAATQALVADTDVADHPDVRLAATQLRAAYLALRRATVVAPATGYVSKRSAQIGQHVTTDSPLMSIAPLDQVWVEANFKESQLRDVRIGQPVTLVSDYYGNDVVFHGTVQGLGAGTGSAFALLPAQNATGNWIKVVQRVPVRIVLAASEIRAHPLRIGLSMAATVDTHDRSGAMLAQDPPPGVAYHTSVYDDQEKGADELIAAIIRKNTVTPAAVADSHPAGGGRGPAVR